MAAKALIIELRTGGGLRKHSTGGEAGSAGGGRQRLRCCAKPSKALTADMPWRNLLEII